jgi:hypothetical protein
MSEPPDKKPRTESTQPLTDTESTQPLTDTESTQPLTQSTQSLTQSTQPLTQESSQSMIFGDSAIDDDTDIANKTQDITKKVTIGELLNELTTNSIELYVRMMFSQSQPLITLTDPEEIKNTEEFNDLCYYFNNMFLESLESLTACNTFKVYMSDPKKIDAILKAINIIIDGYDNNFEDETAKFEDDSEYDSPLNKMTITFLLLLLYFHNESTFCSIRIFLKNIIKDVLNNEGITLNDEDINNILEPLYKTAKDLKKYIERPDDSTLEELEKNLTEVDIQKITVTQNINTSEEKGKGRRITGGAFFAKGEGSLKFNILKLASISISAGLICLMYTHFRVLLMRETIIKETIANNSVLKKLSHIPNNIKTLEEDNIFNLKGPISGLMQVKKCFIDNMFDNEFSHDKTGESNPKLSTHFNEFIDILKNGIVINNDKQLPRIVIQVLKYFGFENVVDIFTNLQGMHTCILTGGAYFVSENVDDTFQYSEDEEEFKIKQILEIGHYKNDIPIPRGSNPFKENQMVVYIKNSNLKQGLFTDASEKISEMIKMSIDPTTNSVPIYTGMLSVSDSFTQNKIEFQQLINNYLILAEDSSQEIENKKIDFVVDRIISLLVKTKNDKASQEEYITLSGILDTAGMLFGVATQPNFIETLKRSFRDLLIKSKRAVVDGTIKLERTAVDTTNGLNDLYKDFIVFIQLKIDLFIFICMIVFIMMYFISSRGGRDSFSLGKISYFFIGLSPLSRNWATVYSFVLIFFIERILKPAPPPPPTIETDTKTEQSLLLQSSASASASASPPLSPLQIDTDTCTDIIPAIYNRIREREREMPFQLNIDRDPEELCVDGFSNDQIITSGMCEVTEQFNSLRHRLLESSPFSYSTKNTEENLKESGSEIEEKASTDTDLDKIMCNFKRLNIGLNNEPPSSGPREKVYGGIHNYKYKRGKTPKRINSKTKRFKKTFRLYKNKTIINRKNKTIKKKQRRNKTIKNI